MNVMYALGWVNLYTGLGPTIVRAVPASACLFLMYEATSKVGRQIPCELPVLVMDSTPQDIELVLLLEISFFCIV